MKRNESKLSLPRVTATTTTRRDKVGAATVCSDDVKRKKSDSLRCTVDDCLLASCEAIHATRRRLERTYTSEDTQRYKRLMGNEVEAANDSCDVEDRK